MYVMFADETNLEETRHVDFFIYGGLTIHSDQVGELSDAIGAIRRDYGFTAGDALKFQVRSRPNHIDRGDWNAAKEHVLEACALSECQFMAVLVHHRIAQNRDQRIDWQLSNLARNFDFFLQQREDVGLFIMDRHSDGSEYEKLRERWSVGGTTPLGRRRNRRIIGYASTCDGASHLASAADIGPFSMKVGHAARARACGPRSLAVVGACHVWPRRERIRAR